MSSSDGSAVPGARQVADRTGANLLNLEVDVLLFDTTSTYFEADPDVDADGTPGFRRYGHSKDHRPDLPQIIIGLAGSPADRSSAASPEPNAGPRPGPPPASIPASPRCPGSRPARPQPG